MQSTSAAWAVLPVVLGGLVCWLLPLTLLAVGLRGRRTDDHPLCRRCGFDLTGKPETTTACGECGADLTRPKAVRVGHRARRRGPLAAGAVIGLLGLGVTVVAVTNAVAGQNWQAHKPLWWLLRETDSGNPATQKLALDEIMSRYQLKRLSAAQLDALTDRGLDRQADAKRPYETLFWGTWVEVERREGRLSDAKWRRYARQAVERGGLDSVRKIVRRGDPLPYWTRKADRVADGSGLYAREKYEDARVAVDAVELPDLPGSRGGSSGGGLSGNGRSGSSIDLKPILDRLSDGPHTLRMRRKVTVHDGKDGSAPVLCVVEIDRSLPFELTGRPTVTLKHDPALRAGVEAAVTVDRVSPHSWNAGKSISISYQINVGGVAVPVGLGCRLSFESGGRAWKGTGGTFACPAGTTNHGYGSGVAVGDFPDDVRTVDVLFTPDPAAAAATTDVFEIWDEPFTIKNVKVVRPAPAPATTASTATTP